MTTAPDYRVVGVNLPSLLPFQAAPQNEEQVVPYLQALHNYLAGDRLAVVQTLNVLSRDRMLAAEVWDDIRVAASSVRVPAVGGPDWVQVEDDAAGTSTGVYTWFFDATSDESVYFPAQLPHGYKQGSDIDFHVHWVGDTSDGNNYTVSWGLEYVWANVGEVFGDTVIAYGNATHLDPSAAITVNKHYLTDVATLDGTGKTVSSVVICRLFRDATSTGATDNYPGEAGLLEADFHYLSDSVGSPEEYSKPV